MACHEEGGIGPFAMTNYAMVKGFAPMIREVIRTDRMPPYHADPHVGQFSDDKRLTPDEIKTLVHWVEAGAPRGEGDDPLGAKHAGRRRMAAGQARRGPRRAGLHDPRLRRGRLPAPVRSRTR